MLSVAAAPAEPAIDACLHHVDVAAHVELIGGDGARCRRRPVVLTSETGMNRANFEALMKRDNIRFRGTGQPQRSEGS
jgi:hypothetical protein